MNVPDRFISSTILEVSIHSEVRDYLALYFTVFDPIVIRKYSIIAMLVFYLDAVCHIITLEALLGIDSRS